MQHDVTFRVPETIRKLHFEDHMKRKKETDAEEAQPKKKAKKDRPTAVYQVVAWDVCHVSISEKKAQTEDPEEMEFSDKSFNGNDSPGVLRIYLQ